MVEYARRICKDFDIADDIVQQSFVECLQNEKEWEGEELIGLLMLIISQRFAMAWRRSGGGKNIAGHGHGRINIDDCDEIKRLSSQPQQIQYCEIMELFRELDRLPERDRAVMTLTAVGYEMKDVAAKLGIGVRTVTAILARRRPEISSALCRTAPILREPRYRGVRKNANKWVASQFSRVSGRNYLGSFDSPEEAALAFDIAALAAYGDRAVLNFPQLKEVV